MEKEKNRFKLFAENAAGAFGNVAFVTAYPTAGAFGDGSDNGVTVELWSEDAEKMIDRRDFNASGWNFGWNSIKGRIAAFNFDLEEHFFTRLTDGSFKTYNWSEFTARIAAGKDKVRSFGEFAKKLVKCFRGARFVTAYPVNGKFSEDGMPERIRFDVWNEEAESTLNCRLFSLYDGWSFTPGRITSFDLTCSPDGSGRNPEFFKELGENLSNVDWSEAVIAV